MNSKGDPTENEVAQRARAGKLLMEGPDEQGLSGNKTFESGETTVENAWRWRLDHDKPPWIDFHHPATEFEDFDGMYLPRMVTSGPHARLEPYEYVSLPSRHIRLLVLYPEMTSNELCGAFESSSLDEETYYKAVSYTWGPPTFTETLHLPEGIIKITPSLASALRRFRHYSKYIKIWADAVCINQSDIRERTQQVSIMADIYRNANVVLIWLGEATEEDAQRFALLWFLAACHEETTSAGNVFFRAKSLPEAFAALNSEYERLFNGSGAWCNVSGCICCGKPLYRRPQTFGESLLQLLPLFGRSWFTRLWVFQESNLAKRAFIFCGSHFIHQRLFYDAAEVTYEAAYRNNPVRLSETTAPLWSLLESACLQVFRMLDGQLFFGTFLGPSEKSAGVRLAYLVDECAELNCSEPRDRIFALVSMLRDPGLKVDYTITMNFLWRRFSTQVLTDPRSWMFSTTDDFKWPGLYMALGAATCDHSETDSRRQSSWSADLSQSLAQAKRRERYRVASDLYAGGHMVLRHTPKLFDSRTLCIRGKTLGSVDRIFPLSQWPGSPKPWEIAFSNYVAGTLLQWYSRCRTFLDNNGANKLSTADLRDILQQGFILQPEDCLTVAQFEDICSHVKKNRYMSSDLDSSEAYHHLDAMLEPSFWDRDKIDQKRLLAIDSEGRFCWIPDKSEPGDIIALLEGTPFPWVVRQSENNRYELLGDAYVHGVMRGEMWPLSPFFKLSRHNADSLEERLMGFKGAGVVHSMASHKLSQDESLTTQPSSSKIGVSGSSKTRDLDLSEQEIRTSSRFASRKKRMLQYSKMFELLDRKRWHMLEEFLLV